jgi:hypothetical protein
MKEPDTFSLLHSALHRVRIILLTSENLMELEITEMEFQNLLVALSHLRKEYETLNIQ